MEVGVYECERGRVTFLLLSSLSEFECEKDGLADLVAELKDANLIGIHRKGLALYKKSFSKDKLLAWLQNNKGMGKPRFKGQRLKSQIQIS